MFGRERKVPTPYGWRTPMRIKLIRLAYAIACIVLIAIAATGCGPAMQQNYLCVGGVLFVKQGGLWIEQLHPDAKSPVKCISGSGVQA